MVLQISRSPMFSGCRAVVGLERLFEFCCSRQISFGDPLEALGDDMLWRHLRAEQFAGDPSHGGVPL